MKSLREQLLAVADAFARAKGLSRSRVSTIVFNQGLALDRIELGGADMTSGRIETALMWFSENWPSDADWPAEIPRPRKTEAA